MRSEFSGPELVPGSLRVYRHWNLNKPYLKSIGQSYVWTSSSIVAECKNSFRSVGHQLAKLLEKLSEEGNAVLAPHKIPVETCGCGIWAYYTPEASERHSGHIFGAIEVSGRVLMGTKGVRAEKAKIQALSFRSPHEGSFMIASQLSDIREIEEGLAEVYKVPIFRSKEELIAAFPPDDISALVPEEKKVVIHKYPLPSMVVGTDIEHPVEIEIWSDGKIYLHHTIIDPDTQDILGKHSEQPYTLNPWKTETQYFKVGDWSVAVNFKDHTSNILAVPEVRRGLRYDLRHARGW